MGCHHKRHLNPVCYDADHNKSNFDFEHYKIDKIDFVIFLMKGIIDIIIFNVLSSNFLMFLEKKMFLSIQLVRIQAYWKSNAHFH